MKKWIFGLCLLGNVAYADLIHTPYTSVTVIPAISTTAYSSGDQMGVVFTMSTALLNKGGHATLQGISVTDSEGQSKAFDVIFFSESPTVTSSDNAAINISDSEMASKAIGAVNFPAANYFATASNSIGTLKDIQMPLRGKAGSTALYGILVSRSTHDFDSTQSLRLVFTFQQH